MLDATVGALRIVLRRPDLHRQPTIASRLRRRRRGLILALRQAFLRLVAPTMVVASRSVRAVVRRRRPELPVEDAIRVASLPVRPRSPDKRHDLSARSIVATRIVAPDRVSSGEAATVRAQDATALEDTHAIHRRVASASDAVRRSALNAWTVRAPARPVVGTAALSSLRISLDAWLARTLPAIMAATRQERALPVAVALLVVVAAAFSVTPSAALHGGTGAVEGSGQELRIGVLGAESSDVGNADGGSTDGAGPSDPGGAGTGASPLAALRMVDAEADALVPPGPYSIDGTLLKPVAVDTSVPDASDQLRTYRVKSGDTLTGLAARFGVSMMTIWWANDLKSKDDLHLGQTLVIPPVTGRVVTVKVGDTLQSIADATGGDPDEIMAFNGLTDEQLVIGQTLVVPGGTGAGIREPKPATHHASTSRSTSVRPPTRYSGGTFTWPVPGGYISQYFHTGHYAIDIANDWGSPIVAAAGGTVIFAGWKNNGGGYQVWISHGSNLYTTYNHMSSVAVGRGQRVGRGQFIGRVGATGDATGPHCHFEVWIGYVWASGSRRVNPLNYL